MPGLSVVHGDLAATDDVAAALDSVRFLDEYTASLDLETGRTAVGHTGDADYPVRRTETTHGTVFLEGYLYDVVDVDAHLRRVARFLAEDRPDALADWVNRRDGDFLIVLASGDGVAVVNDPFARLPVYYATVDGSVVLTRELAALRDLARRREHSLVLDGLAVAQRLTFGYPLGDRTLFEGVRTLPPYSLARIDDDGLERVRIDRHDFGTCRHADRSVAENGRAIAARLVAACENRSIDGRTTVVSLSGGLDSRLLAAAYAVAGLDATAATFETAGGANAEEVRIAGTVAERLGMDWRTYRAVESGGHRETLLALKQGLNSLEMAYILDFYEQVRSAFASPVTVTGDGGDKVLVDLTPTTTPGSIPDLADYVVETNSVLPPSEAAAVAGVDVRSITESVERRLRSYPESDPDRAYVHFLVRERGVNYLNHGEDRNRYYAWNVAPFYSLPLFRYAMNCPDEQKVGRDLTVAVFEHLEPSLADVEYPNFGAPITSLEYRVKRRAYDFFERYPRVRDRLLDLVLSRSAESGDLASTVREHVPALDGTGVSGEAVAALARRHDAFSRPQMEELVTVTSLASGLAGDRSETAEPMIERP